MKDLTHRLGIDQLFSTPYCAWSNGAVERPNRDILAVFKTLLPELQMKHTQWPELIRIVMFTLNQSPITSLGGLSPLEVFTALPVSDPLTIHFSLSDVEVSNLLLSPSRIQDICKNLQNSIVEMSAVAIAARDRLSKLNRKNSNLYLFPFEIGDFVFFSRVDRKGPSGKLYSTWIGPYQIVDTSYPHVFVIKSLINETTLSAHVSRLDFIVIVS